MQSFLLNADFLVEEYSIATENVDRHKEGDEDGDIMGEYFCVSESCRLKALRSAMRSSLHYPLSIETTTIRYGKLNYIVLQSAQ